MLNSIRKIPKNGKNSLLNQFTIHDEVSTDPNNNGVLISIPGSKYVITIGDVDNIDGYRNAKKTNDTKLKCIVDCLLVYNI